MRVVRLSLAVVALLALATTVFGCAATPPVHSVSKAAAAPSSAESYAAAAGMSSIDLNPGASVAMDNGLTVKVPLDAPSGAMGYGYDRWPTGNDAYGRSDYLSDHFGRVKFMSVYHPSSLPDYPFIGGGGPLIARSSTVSVYLVGRNPKGFSIVTNLPGSRRGYILGGDVSGDAMVALRAFWARYHISGTEIPKAVTAN